MTVASAPPQNKSTAMEEDRAQHRRPSGALSPGLSLTPPLLHEPPPPSGAPPDPKQASYFESRQGRPLDPSRRGLFEAHFGVPLDAVRVHTGASAARAAARANANAFTVGADVVMGGGYQEGTARGDALLVHELGHAVQQGVRPLSPGWLPFAAADAERSVIAPIPSSQPPAIAREQTGSTPTEEPFAALWERLVVARRLTPRAAPELAREVARRMSAEADLVQHGADLVTYLFDEGLAVEAQTLLNRVEAAWRAAASAGSPVGRPPPSLSGLGATDITALVRRGTEDARAGAHTQAFQMLGLAYFALQVQMRAFSSARSDRIVEAQGSPDRGLGGFQRLVSYWSGGGGYHWMREILNVYPTLERQARVAGDEDRAARLSGLGLLLRNELRERWLLEGANLMTAEVTPVITQRGEGLTLHGANAENIELQEFAGMPRPSELEPGTHQQASTAQITEALSGQTELVAELMERPEIRTEFNDQAPDLSDEAQRQRAWRVMYRVFQAGDTLGFGGLHSLMTLIGRWLHAYTIHTGYNIRDWGSSYLDTPLPTDMLGRVEMDCGVYAISTAWELYQVARAAQPPIHLNFELLATPNHVELIIHDVAQNVFYLANNDTISPPRSGDMMQEGSNAMVPVLGHGYVATWAFRMPLASTQQRRAVFRRDLWENYLDAVSIGLAPVPKEGPADTRSEGERNQIAHRNFYDAQTRFDQGARALRVRLEEIRSALASAADPANELGTGLTTLVPVASALLALFRGLAVQPVPRLILDERRERRRARLNRVGRQVYLYTSETPGEVHPLVRFAQALLRLEAIGGTLSPEARQYIQAIDALQETFRVDLDRYRAQGLPARF